MIYFSMTDGIVKVEDCTTGSDRTVATIDISDGGSQEALDALWGVAVEHGTDWTYSSSMHHGDHADAWDHLVSLLSN